MEFGKAAGLEVLISYQREVLKDQSRYRNTGEADRLRSIMAGLRKQLLDLEGMK